MLDTLCNVFGSVILIACVLAILPRQTMPPSLVLDELTGIMLERRIEFAEGELERLTEEIDLFEVASDPDLATLQNRRDSLKQTFGALQARATVREDAEIDSAALRAIAAQGNPTLLASRLQELKAGLAEIEAASKVAEEKIAFLEKRLKKLQAEAKALKGGRVNLVRFPRERAQRRDPFPIIVWRGAIYPLQVGVHLNDNPAIHRIPWMDDDAFSAKPVEGQGWTLPADKEALKATLRATERRGLTISIYLYPDGHELFQDLKSEIFEAGGTYGIEFVDAGRTLNFGSTGTQPPEL